MPPPSPQIFIKTSSSGDEDPCIVRHAVTHDCTSAEEGDERLVSHVHDDEDQYDLGPERKSGHLEQMDESTSSSSWQNVSAPLFYVSTFAILGTVLRLYVGRFFGLDCLQKENDSVVESDFLFPLSSLVCITSDGRSERGGALFIDLPTNMLGSFCMGLLCSSEQKPQVPPLFWLRRDHPLQRDTALYLGLKVGLCGCLTTFSSWNTQMIVMMDGTDTIYGPQVAAALFGYLIGMIGAISSYIAGTHVMECFSNAETASEHDQRNDVGGAAASVLHRPAAVVVSLTCAAVLVGLFIGDFHFHVPQYRELWMAALLSPLGAVLRWNMMQWNALSSKQGFHWGTWSANFTGALVSSFVAALSTFVVATSSVHYASWTEPALTAVGSGFTGSLSTVSSLVHELAILESVRHAYGYVLATIVPTMLMSLLIYVPIARFW